VLFKGFWLTLSELGDNSPEKIVELKNIYLPTDDVSQRTSEGLL